MGLSLITKAEYKTYAGIKSTTQDALIDSLITKVSELVKNLCRRTFVDYVDDAKIEYSDGGSNTILLLESPVRTISSVAYSADYGQTYTNLVEFTDYVYVKSTEAITALNTSGFTYIPNGYKVTYTAGYEVLPEDLKLAIMDLVSYYIKNDSAVHSNKAPGTNTVQIEYVTNTQLPAHIKRVLDLYTANYV